MTPDELRRNEAAKWLRQAAKDGSRAIALSQLIDLTRQRAARTLNAELVLMYWKIGARIRREVLGGERAAYGEQIVPTLSRQLTASYGTPDGRIRRYYPRQLI